MKDDRLRVPIDDLYLHAVGLATICFARLEWDAVWCCEKMKPGYIKTIRKKTAGAIAIDLLKLSTNHADPAIAKSLHTAATEFARLVTRRNDLVHSSPATAKNGDQRLFRHGEEWTVDAVNDLADEFVEGGGPLNFHIHNLL